MAATAVTPARRRFLLASLAAPAVLVAGCGLNPHPTLRLGFNPWPGYEFFKLAEQLGYYRQLGLDVQLVEFTSLGDSRRAFERNQIDVAAGTGVEMLTASTMLRQVVQAFFITNVSVGSDYLLALPPLNQPQDLRGKRIAVEPGSLNLLLLYLALNSAQLRLGDVHMVPMAQASMPGAFKRGEVDAVVVYPPASDELLALVPEQARILYDSSRAQDAILDLVYARQSLIESRPRELALLIRGFEMAREYTLKHADDAYARMAARTGRDRGDFERDIKGLRLVPLADQHALFQPGGRIEIILHETLQALRDAGMQLHVGNSPLSSAAILKTSLAP